MGKVIYRIRDWDKHYENNRTRELEIMRWVPIPNKHDGDGYTELVSRENGAAMLGCWLGVIQVASKCGTRGTLLRDSAEPHDAASIARITRLPAGDIQNLLDVASSPSINWIERLEITEDKQLIPISHVGAIFPQVSATESHPTDYGMEGNGREENGKNIPAAPDASPTEKKEPRDVPNSPHHRLIAHWKTSWEFAHGRPAVFKGGKDGAAIKRLLEYAGSEDDAKAAIERYMTDTTDFFQGHPLSKLVGSIERFLVAGSNSNRSDSVIDNFMRRHANDKR